MLNRVVASPIERVGAAFTLAGDYAREAYDAITRRPRYVFFRFRSQLVAGWMYLFHVPGGWQGVLLRAHLVLEMPALVSPFIRPGSPPFARDGDPSTEGLIDAVAPAVFLGANMTTEDTHFALVIFTLLALASILGLSLGCG